MGRMLPTAGALLCLLSAAASVHIDTKDGGYKDIRVSISKDVPYDESILDNIKSLFRSSSEFLHRATNGRVYFKQVTIEVPHTWPMRDSARPLSLTRFDRSDVRVDVPTEAQGDMPFTQQLMPCGQPGDFIQLTPGFLALTQNATAQEALNPAYVFVQEWAHFRYGVFDEYGSLEDKRYPLTYCHKGMVKLNACSERMAFVARSPTGGRCRIDSKCRLEKDCVVTFRRQPGDQSVESSVMSMPYIANVSQLCRHNPLAPNKQNALCNERSTWEVISSNADFRSIASPNISKRIEVTFQEEQRKNDLPQSVVLVLDVSVSMKNYYLLKFLKQAATSYIQGIQDSSQRLAVVTFSTKAQVAHPLLLVNASTRQGFLDTINGLIPDGRTCIGCGLTAALKLLNTTSERSEGAVIVLVSDGKENEDPDILSVKPEVEKSEVTVNTVALMAAADHRLEELAVATKGKAYAFQRRQKNVASELETAFVQATSTQADHTQRVETLVDFAEVFKKKFERQFHIDAGVGNNTVVFIKRNYPERLDLKSWLVDPSGDRCQACKETHDSAGTIISIPSPAQVGAWTLHLETYRTAETAVSVHIKSQARSVGGEPILATCEVGYKLVERPEEAVVYAKVASGKRAVLNAVVEAEVTGPDVSGQPYQTTFLLHDDGQAPDNHANDGTYSGYFSRLMGKGRYAVYARVSNQNGTRVADPLECSGRFFSTAMFTLSTAPSPGAASEYPMDDFIIVNPTSDDAKGAAGDVLDTVEPFQRAAHCGSFQVNVDIVEEQVPPGDIRDLTVADVQVEGNDTLLVQLTWTWPGAHLTEGTAAAVDIRASTDYERLKSNFGNQTEITNASVVVGNLFPLRSGDKHVVTVALPAIFATHRDDGAREWSAYLAARVSNSDGLTSNNSNTVLAFYAPASAKTAAATTTTPAADGGDGQSPVLVLSLEACILIAAAAAVVLCVIVVTMLIRRSSIKRKIYHVVPTMG
ncbi:calcium-activated chloride channel regulator 3A-1-like [Haemaphysalis longicornis]